MVETAAKSHRGCNDDGANDQNSHGPTPFELCDKLYWFVELEWWHFRHTEPSNCERHLHDPPKGLSGSEVRANVYGRKEDCTAKRANLGVTLLASAALVF
jgi:hypothetical protein